MLSRASLLAFPRFTRQLAPRCIYLSRVRRLHVFQNGCLPSSVCGEDAKQKETLHTAKRITTSDNHIQYGHRLKLGEQVDQHQPSREDTQPEEGGGEPLVWEDEFHSDLENARLREVLDLETNQVDDAENIIASLTETDVENFPRYQKPFVDLKRVVVRGGHGGNASRTHVRSLALKGPGYGGNGGNIILRSTYHEEDFISLASDIQAKRGGDAEGTSRGLNAKDRIVQVPPGTIIRKRIKTSEKDPNGRQVHKSIFWHQFLKEGEELIVARGGRGGLSPSNRKKKDGRAAETNEKVHLELELRIINDACLAGLPNAGKTSLLAAMTRHYTRIGYEEFSTTRPHIGVMSYRDGTRFRIMDLPALTLHSHLDSARGKRVLRHTYRSKLIIYVVDVSLSSACVEPLEAVQLLRHEISTHYPAQFEKRKHLVIATKCDMLHRESLVRLDSLYYRLRHVLPDVEVIATSAKFGLGIERAATAIRQLLDNETLVEAHRVMSKPLGDILLPAKQDFERAEAFLKDSNLYLNQPINEGAVVKPLP